MINKKDYYMIDVGSSSIKVYLKSSDSLTLIKKKSYKFSKEYEEEKPFNFETIDKEMLFQIFLELIETYELTKENCKLYATGIYRGIINKKEFVNDFFERTSLYFYIVSQDLEAFYLEKKLSSYSEKIGNTIIFNIGGGSIEIIFCEKGLPIDRKKEKWGVKKIKNDFGSIDSFKKIVENAKLQFSKKYNATFENAFYTGGELTYMKKAKYPLEDNNLFTDKMHSHIIEVSKFKLYNEKLFEQKSIEDLKALMPEDPLWMEGARACSAIAQAICEIYNIKKIIPSDFNMVDGIIEQDAQNVVLCGSFNRHLKRIGELIGVLNEKGINVLSPRSAIAIDKIDDFVILEGDRIARNCKWSLEMAHLDFIEKSDYVVICNFDGYIGFSTAFELGYAQKCGKKLIFIESKDVNLYFNGPCEIGILV